MSLVLRQAVQRTARTEPSARKRESGSSAGARDVAGTVFASTRAITPRGEPAKTPALPLVGRLVPASDQRERKPHDARGSANPDATPARCSVDWEYIKQLVEEGRSLNSLARETGIPRYTLARELKLKFGVSSGVVIRETKRRRDEAIVQYRRRRPDATCREIGKLFGCVESTVAKALAAANGKRVPFDLEPIKKTMRERPFMRTDDLCRAFGVSSFLVNQARQELTDEGFDVALEREILAEEFLTRNPDASVAEIAEHFGTSTQIVARAIHGTGKLDRDEILEENLRTRAVKGPRWYRAEMARKNLPGMRLPPEMLARYLELFVHKSRHETRPTI